MAVRRPEFERRPRTAPGMKAPHDIGGDPAGPIDTADHEKAFWEHRADAIRNLTRHVARTDEMRRAQESLGAELYEELSYTERQVAAMVQIFLEKGVLTTAELAAKMAEIDARERASE